MVKHYKLIFFSLLRLIKEMGLFYGLLASVLLVSLIVFIYFCDNAFLSGVITLMIVLMIQSNRKDIPWLKHFFRRKTYWLVFLEYVFLSSIFLVSCVVQFNWQLFIGSLFVISLVPLLKSGGGQERWQNIPLLHLRSVDLVLKSEFRQYYPLLLLCFLLIYFTSSLGKNDVFLVLIYLYIILISALHTMGDSPWIIRMSKSPGFYLQQKLVAGLLNYSMLTVFFLPASIILGTDVFPEFGVSILSGLFLFCLNQLAYPAFSNNRLIVLVVQFFSIIIFIMSYFYMPMLLILGFLLFIVFTKAFLSLKTDYIW
jgi:hypothetical protein